MPGRFDIFETLKKGIGLEGVNSHISIKIYFIKVLDYGNKT